MSNKSPIASVIITLVALCVLGGCDGGGGGGHRVSNQAPTAAILKPRDGETFVEGDSIEFVGMATDPEEGALTGASLVWTATPGGTIGTDGSFTRDDLSAGTYTITLTATDSGDASGTDSITIDVTPPNQLPTVQILAPGDGASFQEGTTIVFRGTAADPEDGALTGASLVWRAFPGGVIGTGELFTRDDLTAGTYTITLTATDSAGESASDSVTIQITPPNRPPQVTIQSPTDGASVMESCPVVFEGSAVDLEDGELAGDSLVWTSSVDGQIGTGESFTRDDLSWATHTITLTATDSGGASSSDSIGIEITYRYPDVYLVKTDSFGNLEWEKRFGGTLHDCAFSVQQTSDGGYVLAGDMGAYGPTAEGDVYLAKTDSSGTVEWEKTFGGSYRDEAFSVQQTTDGGYIVAGELRFSPEFYSPYHAYLVKVDHSGNLEWEKVFTGADGNDTAFSVRQTTEGGYILAGTRFANSMYVVKTDRFGNLEWEKTYAPYIGVSVDLTDDGGYIIAGGDGSRCWLVKTDSNGDVVWEKPVGEQGYVAGLSVRQTSDGGYIVAAGNAWHLPSPYESFESCVIKTDACGDVVWQKKFTGYDIFSVRQTADGGYVITGAADFFPERREDAYLGKTDSSGNIQWEKTFGGAGIDYGYSVEQTTDGGYIIAGEIAAPCTRPLAGGPTKPLVEDR
jgi:hypothetical protein